MSTSWHFSRVIILQTHRSSFMSKLAFLLIQNLAKLFNILKIPLIVPPGEKCFWHWQSACFYTFFQNIMKIIHQLTKIQAFSRIVKLCLLSRVMLSCPLFLKLGNFQRRATLVDTTFPLCRHVPPHHHPASKVVLGNLLRVLATLLVFLPPLSSAYSGR